MCQLTISVITMNRAQQLKEALNLLKYICVLEAENVISIMTKHF